MKHSMETLQPSLAAGANSEGTEATAPAPRPWVGNVLREFSLFRLPAASEFMERAWDALEPSQLLSDMHREYVALVQRIGRAVITEERWRRPHHCPARYVYTKGKTVTVMQLEMGKSELRLVFRMGSAVTKGFWRHRNGPSDPIGRVEQERRIVLSLAALAYVPVRDCFAFMLDGLPAAGWLRLCGVGSAPAKP